MIARLTALLLAAAAIPALALAQPQTSAQAVGPTRTFTARDIFALQPTAGASPMCARATTL